ncbi:DNA gyrase subunit A [Leadbetterella byssophila DSM 17132]|jgi:DNA gyrase subunit A|uniref:DNA gyrase subunit A n=1 Tax=Leadbetterella byssophila (strain DSM 17132 / JCM 16389 / KACC 11308 / NBRC 106382 / 4M15) TaxID=649349 RepID=E4RR46_LEAB4|nr:DNA gyrase subunit A [Leadbetterella byssophila]ADQ16641.1 DNA gyrase subunit A [Leadbetterella byssophila DSM 17132]
MAENNENAEWGGSIIPINIEDEMRGAYIDYSMSVIVSRALPDVRDGFKPVHRRVLFGMSELGVYHNRPYKKSARIVGEVLGKYHPHGDSSVYDTMVRMAQDWSLRYPLVDGQGNFGSVDGDSPAAMRYTEARLRRIAEEMLADINKETVDFRGNFDDSLQEPTVLPSRIPNLLLNGTSGIAVGMATNMAPHNLSEVTEGITAYIDNPEITIEELMHFIKAPDFPTGGIIYGYGGVKAAFETGRGRVVIRSVANFEVSKTGKEQIVVTEIPYLVNKAAMIEKTAELVNDKKIEGISGIRDESDRQGLRIVYDLKKDAVPNVVLNNLYKYTQLQTSFSINNVALVHGKPETLNLKQLIEHYVKHRLDVITRRTQYDLREAEKRAHILEGLLIALDHLDEVISLIRSSKDPDEARNGLMEKFALSEIQARAILDMRLQRLTGLERDKITEEYKQIKALIEELNAILASEEKKKDLIKADLLDIKTKYGDERRSKIEMVGGEFNIEDMIPDDEMLVTVTSQGYIKRTNLSEYKSQSRGGTGSRGVKTKDDDYTEHLFMATNHNYLLFFTEKGRLYWLRVFEVPEGNKTSKGRAIQNLINIESDDKIRAVLNVKTLSDEDYIKNNYIVMCTQNGIVKKTLLEMYSRPRQNGIIAININEGDQLIDVALTNGNDYIIIAAGQGKAVRFHESGIRPMGRGATGVKGISLAEDDKAIGMICVNRPDAQLLVVSEKGYGKRSDIEDYRITSRGAKGVKTLNMSEKVGNLVAIKEVTDEDDLMIITTRGIAIRMHVSDLRVMGRNTQGVRLIKLNDKDGIASITRIIREEDEEENAEEGGETPTAAE